MTEIHHLTLTALLHQLQAGALDARDVAAHYLRRAHDHNAELSAFFALVDEPPPALSTGPLLGIPVALKDTEKTAGLPTTFGSLAFRGHMSRSDGSAAGAWAGAGAVVIGKTATSEFGCLCAVEPDPRLAPPPSNPRWPGCGPGGSSAGAAVAVAAQLVPVAHGSDAGGSIRIPAALNGVVGFKPSGGENPRLSWRDLDTDGVLARDVSDAQLAAIAIGLFETPVAYTTSLRIGVPPEDLMDDVAPELRAAVLRTADLLASLGHYLDSSDPRISDDTSRAYLSVWSGHLASLDIPAATEHLLQDVPRLLRQLGRELSAGELLEEWAVLARARREALDDPIDIHLSPVTTRPSLPVGSLTRGDAVEVLARQARFAPFTVRANIEGRPSVSLPVSPAGPSPVAVLLTGRRGRDAELLDVAASLEPLLDQSWSPSLSRCRSTSLLTPHTCDNGGGR